MELGCASTSDAEVGFSEVRLFMLTIFERNVSTKTKNEREAGTTGVLNLYPCDNALMMGTPILAQLSEACSGP